MEEDELFDWEMLHGSDTESIDSITSEKKSESSSLIDDIMILSDHFSVDHLIKRSGEINDPSQFGVLESGDSFWVDFGSDPLNLEVVRIDLDGFRSGDGEVRVIDFEAIEDKHLESEAVAELESDDFEVDNGRNVESESGVEEPIEDLSKSWSDSGGNELVSGDSGVVNSEEEIVSDSGVVSNVEVGSVRCGDESKSRETVWWKMPFVFLKYSAFKIGPVWSVSLAAAVMSLVILRRRRLYDMRKKAQRFNLKVTIDDKKVSRVMNKAARLNEMFTEVRRVPVIHPTLPSPGAWPVLSLR